MSDDAFPLMVDVKLRRPACVLLQAAYGCRTGIISQLFDAETWLLAPTDDLRRVNGTMEQWQAFAKECNARHTAGTMQKPVRTPQQRRNRKSSSDISA